MLGITDEGAKLQNLILLITVIVAACIAGFALSVLGEAIREMWRYGL